MENAPECLRNNIVRKHASSARFADSFRSLVYDLPQGRRVLNIWREKEEVKKTHFLLFAKKQKKQTINKSIIAVESNYKTFDWAAFNKREKNKCYRWSCYTWCLRNFWERKLSELVTQWVGRGAEIMWQWSCYMSGSTKAHSREKSFFVDEINCELIYQNFQFSTSSTITA